MHYVGQKWLLIQISTVFMNILFMKESWKTQSNPQKPQKLHLDKYSHRNSSFNNTNVLLYFHILSVGLLILQ